MLLQKCPLADFPELVVGRVVQRVRAQVAPVAIEAQPSVGRSRTADLEHPRTDVQSDARRAHFGDRDSDGDLAALFLGQRVSLVPCGGEAVHRPVGQRAHALQADPEVSIVMQGIRVFAVAGGG